MTEYLIRNHKGQKQKAQHVSGPERKEVSTQNFIFSENHLKSKGGVKE